MADGLKTSISTNRQNGSCVATSTSDSAKSEDEITGKYGKAKILQDKEDNKLICGILYTFNSSGVSDKLTSKKIALKVNEDSGKLTLETVKTEETSTEVKKYLPNAFKE